MIKLGSPKTKHLSFKEVADKVLRNPGLRRAVKKMADNIEGYQPKEHSGTVLPPPKKP